MAGKELLDEFAAQHGQLVRDARWLGNFQKLSNKLKQNNNNLIVGTQCQRANGGRNSVEGLLISVENQSEAGLVLSGNVAILDIKSPSNGSLGRVGFEQAHRIAECYFDHVNAAENRDKPRLSIALGELKAILDLPLDQDWLKLVRRFDFAKIGLAGIRNAIGWRNDWQRIRDLLLPCQLVPVAYLDDIPANSPMPERVIELARQEQCKTILFDTCFKDGGNLFQVRERLGLIKLVRRAQAYGIKIVVAGSIDLGVLRQVAELQPDFVGVRGAVCDGERNEPISRLRLDEFLSACQEYFYDCNSDNSLNGAPSIT